MTRVARSTAGSVPAASLLAAALLAAALVAALLAVALSASPPVGASPAASPVVAATASPSASPLPVDDWHHVWEVVRLAGYEQGEAALETGVPVYYLGDSVARESVVDDAGWTQELRTASLAVGKALATCHTLAGHAQTFGMDAQLLEALPDTPQGRPRGIVLIGVGLSRFIGPPAPLELVRLDLSPPGVPPELSQWTRHKYDARSPLSRRRKRQLAVRWMERRWAGFRASKAANLAAIAELIEECKRKRLRPVLFDVPLAVDAVGAVLDKPRTAIRSSCTALARRHGIKYLHFTAVIRLRGDHFWDLHHLLPPGAARWQRRLSSELVKVLPAETPAP